MNEIAICQILIRKFLFLRFLRINKGPVFVNRTSEGFKRSVIEKIINFGKIKKTRPRNKK